MPDSVIPSPIVPQPIDNQGGLEVTKKRSPFKISLIIGGLLLALTIIAAGVAFVWYNNQLAPIGTNKSELKEFTVVEGSTSGQIGKKLQEESIIKNATVFDIYARLSNKSNLIKVGTYKLSPADTTQQILQHLVDGTSLVNFNITFLPGATLAENVKVLEKAGYSDQEITSALNETYDTNDSLLFKDKPASADLEGYIYGETYNFDSGATVKDILNRTFDEFYSVIKDNDLINKFAKQDLNLYQGITLASIVQREVSSPVGETQPTQDQKQVAQVFYTRLRSGMSLGSDVTYQYIADKTGVARDPDLDSPYNTRRYTGLPPGPISAPGLTALLATAAPASTDYQYFLSGDDDITYFAHTNAEHESNIVIHCKIKCSTL